MGETCSPSELLWQEMLTGLEEKYLEYARGLQEASSPEQRSWGTRCEALAFRLMTQLHPAARAAQLSLRRDPTMRSLARTRERFFATSDTNQQRGIWQELSEAFQRASPAIHRYACSLEQIVRGWGFSGFVDAALAARGLSRPRVEGWLTDFLTNSIAIANANRPWENLRPLPGAPALPVYGSAEEDTVQSTLESLGFPHALATAIPVVKYPASNGRRSAFCFALDPPIDVRIAVRQGSESGLSYVQALLHELGHALHFTHATAEDLADLQEALPFVEGIAFTFEFLTLEPDWLTKHVKLFNSADKTATELWQLLLQDLRWVILEALFELSLFSSLPINVYDTWAQLVYRWGFAVPETGAGYSLFAADEAARPLQYLDYALGRLIGIHSVVALRGLRQSTARADRLRTIYFANGARVAWTEKVREFTGSWPPHPQ